MHGYKYKPCRMSFIIGQYILVLEYSFFCGVGGSDGTFWACLLHGRLGAAAVFLWLGNSLYICLHMIFQVDCSKYTIDNSGLAIEGGSTGLLASQACPRLYKPICSTDGRTFSNECSFCHYKVLSHALSMTSFFSYFNYFVNFNTDFCRSIVRCTP